MSDARRCANCGVEEVRKRDARGHEQTNLNPLNGLCLNCTVTASAARYTFTSRRDATKGQTRDGRALAAGKDAS